MKILFITEYFPIAKDLRFSGGVEARTYYIARNLARRHKVYVVTSWLKGSKRREKLSGINVYRVGPKRAYQASAHVLSFLPLIGFIKAAIALGATIKPDIVDGGNFISHFISKQISIKNKIPVVFWYPDVYIGQWIKTSGLISGISGWVLEKYNLKSGSNHFISISKQTTNKLTQNGIQLQEITEIPCGVDIKLFNKTYPKHSPNSIICISRLVSYKNVSKLVWAFAMLRKKGLDCNLKIIGTGPEERKLKEIIRMLKIKGYVKFYKNLPQKELIKQLKFSSIYCCASSVEGFGISLIEAAACGIPSVVTNIAVFREVTKKGLGVLFFNEPDIKDLERKLEKLLRDRNIYRRKQKEARTLAEFYDWRKITLQTENIYKQLT